MPWGEDPPRSGNDYLDQCFCSGCNQVRMERGYPREVLRAAERAQRQGGTLTRATWNELLASADLEETSDGLIMQRDTDVDEPEDDDSPQINCVRCSRRLRNPQYRVVGQGDDDEERESDTFACGSCVRMTYRRCSRCRDYVHRDHVITPTDDYGNFFCRPCADARLSCCAGCDQWSYYGLHDNGEYCQTCAYENDCECDDCDDRRDQGLIHNYSYRPQLEFFSLDGTSYSNPPKGEIFLGMELEVTTPYTGRLKRARIAQDHLGDLGLLKEDGSVSGFEIVTQPMSHSYAKEKFPWQMLIDLENAGCDGEDTGIHVHVSRSSFDNPSHIYRWLRFIYRNQRPVQAIARRRDSQWASFEEPSERGYDEYNDVYVWDAFQGRERRRTPAERAARRKSRKSKMIQFAKGATDGERYSAVNVQNNATFEVRVFRSSLIRQEVMAALDLVAGSVEYTRELTIPAIINGGWTWDGFIKWARAIEGNPYEALIAESRERVRA